MSTDLFTGIMILGRDCNLCGVKTEMGLHGQKLMTEKVEEEKNGRITVCSGKLCV